MKEKIVAFFADKKKRADFILIGSIALFSVLALIISIAAKNNIEENRDLEKMYVAVSVDNIVVSEYPLSVNGEFELNGGTNVLVIENGKAYLNYATCPDKTCVFGNSVHGNKISIHGESIICIPNHVVVEIVDKSGNGDGGLI